MGTRADSAAATRAALLRAAGSLLDEGGPSAVTLRDVGTRAGVSRGAPYGHFPDKDHLLSQLVVDGWMRLADSLADIRGAGGPGSGQLEAALMALLDLARRQPHLYALMWVAPTGDPQAILVAAGRSQDIFLDIVAEVVGRDEARKYGAMLMSSAHGIASMALSGHVAAPKWNASPQELIVMLVDSMPHAARDSVRSDPDGHEGELGT
ncbi:AcrR family transcriptional regulator [Microbacteriaceae bacterium SG_E_30_P1]|uniref:AcrR family transcriptional regulator n=1 Tax=Antiquaquibacter oligotrophicus TaxID=2880260 RepID=A0ABT6KM77_9MICO|nr:TetR/AcrR family transcriptional regulator [Antiquaquibacter oligotrophicus]MDH6180851.1 AcrR family transcriptional regulator [Antiquaquibacter oligotrophicus]UDF13435.1 TetR/AcrR family transcriptional regulator [Antiquaquibacter oligotrophicus]